MATAPLPGSSTPTGNTPKKAVTSGPDYTQSQVLRLAGRIASSSKYPGEINVDRNNALQPIFKGYTPKQIDKLSRQANVPELTRRAIVNTTKAAATPDALPGESFGGGIGTLLWAANRPAQAVLGAITEGGRGGTGGIKGAVQGFTGQKDYTPVRAVSQGILGQSPQQALKTEKHLGWAGAGANIIGSAALDPLTYLSFGTSAAGTAAATRASELSGVAAEDILGQGGRAFGRQGLKDLAKQQAQAVAEAGGSRLAQRVSGRRLVRGVRGAPGGLKIAGRSVPGTTNIGDTLAKGYARSPLAKVGDPVENLFRNRAGVVQAARRGEPGYAGVANQLETNAAKFEGELATTKQQLASEVQHALRIGEIGPRGDALTKIRDSLDVGGQGVQLSAKEAVTRGELRRVYDSMLGEARQRGLNVSRLGTGVAQTGDKVAETIKAQPLTALIQRLKDPSVADPLALKTTQAEKALADSYTAHVLTPAGRELFDRNPKVFEQSGYSGPGGYAEHRVVEGSLAEKNAKLAPQMEAAGLKGPAYEPDLRKAIITRGNAQAQDLAKREYLQTLPEVKSADGVPMALSEKDWVGAGSPKDRVPLKIPGDMGAEPTTMYFHKEVAPEVDRVMKMLGHRGSDNPFVKAIDAVNQEWKKLAVGTPGFASRNLLQGNLFNGMYLGDVGTRMTLLDIKDATRFQLALKRGFAAGDPYKFLSTADRDAVEAAQRSGALGTGFLSSGADITIKRGVKSRLRDETLGGAAKRVAHRANLLAGIRDVNTAFENNSRLALFLHNYKTLGADGAAKIVRERLFDYNDLTPFEQNVMKRVSPFYTWTRKNIPLQIANMAKHPSRLSRIEQVRNEINRKAGPITKGPLPGYLAESGGVKMPFNIPGVGGKEQVFKPDLPINQAADTLSPILKLLQGDSVDRRKAVLDLINNNTGGGSGILKGVGEYGTGQNWFTGQKYKPGQRIDSVLGKIDPAVLNLLKEAVPTLGRAQTLLPQSAGDQAAQARRIVSTLLGVGVYPLNDQTRNSALYERLDHLKALQQTLNDTGHPVPKLTDLAGYTRPKKAGSKTAATGRTAPLPK